METAVGNTILQQMASHNNQNNIKQSKLKCAKKKSCLHRKKRLYMFYIVIWDWCCSSSFDVSTCHNSADSVSTSNIVCVKEVATRSTFYIAGIMFYTCNLVTDIQCTRYKNTFNKRASK